MADNIKVTAGTGSDPAVAADDVSSVFYQRIKVDGGGDGVSLPIVAGQQTMANSLPVAIASNQTLPLPSGASTSAKQDTAQTSLTSIDSKITAVNTGAVVISAALPAGTNVIGHVITDTGSTTAVTGNVTVVQATGTNLHAVVDSGTVTTVTTLTGTTTLTPGTGATNLGKAEDAVHGDGDTGVMALAVRKNTAASTSGSDGDYQPLITNTTGHLWVDASGQTLTVGSHAVTNAGTFAVQAAEADGANVTLGAKADAKSTATDTTAVTLMQVAKQISASVQAPPSQAVTNAGTFAVQATLQAASGVDIGKLTANQSVNVAQMNGATVLMGVGATGTGAQRVVQANDAGRTLVSIGGSAASNGNNTIVAAGTNKLKVFAFSLSTTSTTAVTCIFQSGASGAELWRCVLQAPTSVSTGANLAVSPPASLFATASATLLNLNLSGAITVHWSVAYFDEA